ncbi:MAG: potassium channel family protein [Chitinispirillaceae bacterium]
MNKAKRRICIIGLGFFGSGLARSLAAHSEVLVIDHDINQINAISEQVQRALCIDARDFQALSSAVTDKFDEAVVSIGEELESSILCTLYLKRIGVKSIRAKASSEEHAEILRSIGATQVVFPELETAERLAQKIRNPNLLDFIPITQGYLLMDVKAPEMFHNRSLESLHFRNRFGVFVIAIKRPDEEFIFLPNPDSPISPEDVLVVVGQENDMSKFLSETGSTPAT